MIKQHIYRCVGGEYRTAALSQSLRESAWLPLLEQQMELHCAPRRPSVVYFQYPLGKGLVLSRCATDPDGEGDTYIAHQLVFDSQEDIRRLMEIRPVSPMIFVRRYPLEQGAEAGDLPEMAVDQLRRDQERENGREAVRSLFGGRERLLAVFLAALSLAARDKRQTVRVAARELPDRLSETAHRAMELLLSFLDAEDAMRLSYCTMQSEEGAAQYSAYFSAGADQAAASGAATIVINLAEGEAEVSRDVELTPGEEEIALARALLSPEEAEREGLEDLADTPEDTAGPEGKTPRREPARILKKRRLNMPAYTPDMPFRAYFEQWLEKMRSQRNELTEAAFETLAAEEWPQMLGNMVSASENPENLGFLRDMNNVIARLEQEPVAGLPEDALRDMNMLLLDSVLWRKVNLNRPRVAALMRKVTVRAMELEGEAAQEGCALAARAVYRLLTAPGNVQEMLEELALLEEKEPKRFEAVQLCLRRYVQGRIEAEKEGADEALAAAAMGAYVRFTDGVPDLRLVDKLRDRLEQRGREQTAQQFQRLTDRMRRRLHAARPASMQWHDVKVFLWISGALLALIVGITLWYFLNT